MKKLLAVCPTRERPQLAEEMLRSFLLTAKDADIIFVLDTDDPQLTDYNFLHKYPCFKFLTFRQNTTQYYNEIIQQPQYNAYEYYSCTNDDFVYKTDGWDTKLIEEIEKHGSPGIAFGNDLLQGRNLPTTSIISGEIVRAIGYLQNPALTHLFGDNVWKVIGKQCQCLHYRNDVIIEHRHFVSGKTKPDTTSKFTNSQKMYKKDGQAFISWLENQSFMDCLKVWELKKEMVKK